MDEELLKQVELLTSQVKTLAQTQEAQARTLDATIQRLNQIIEQFQGTTGQLLQVKDTLETTNEALLESLNENDSNLDDLATITEGLVQATQQLKSILPQSMQESMNQSATSSPESSELAG